MSKWADEFFVTWQKAWSTGTEEVMKHVTDDIEYWDVTMDEPLRGRDAYAEYCDGFFRAFEGEFSLREPVIHEGDRVTEPWAYRGRNVGPTWIGLPASGRMIETHGTDIFEFRDGKVCREHSYYDVLDSLRQLGLWVPIGSRAESAAMGVGGLAIRGRRALDSLPLVGNRGGDVSGTGDRG
jgi:steroid delta-isomerase-like uncharacterized protein